jgi:hypothetical protein
MGVDFTVFLSKPEAIIPGTSFSKELYKIDSRITDVIGFKTFKPNQDFTKFVALEDPTSPEFDYRSDLLPIGMGEFKPEQIRGNASTYGRLALRILSVAPDGVRDLLF